MPRLIQKFAHQSLATGLTLGLVIALTMPQPSYAQKALFIDQRGAVGIGTGSPDAALHILRTDGTAQILIEETSPTTKRRDLLVLRNNGASVIRFENTGTGNYWTFSNNQGNFVINNPGSIRLITTTGQFGNTFRIKNTEAGIDMMKVTGTGDLIIAGTLSEGSSRAIKDHIVPVEPKKVLAKLEELTIAEWSYETNLDTRHMGPMAEEFYALFGLGPDNKHIAPKDLAGVALASIKALNQKLEQQVARLHAKNSALNKRLSAMAAQIAQLKAKTSQIAALKAQLQQIRTRLPSRVAMQH